MAKKITEQELNERLNEVAEYIIDYVNDRGYVWTKELSSAMSGQNSMLTTKKRELSRFIFYKFVGAGGLLGGLSKKIYMVNSCIGFNGKIIADHIISPQELGEYFMDSLMGYYTPKNSNNLCKEVIIDWMKMASKVVLVPNQKGGLAINNWLSYYTAISRKKKGIPITSESKYRYLNEVFNKYDLNDKLTVVYKSSGLLVLESDLNQLFQVPAGLSDWEQEKYGAINYKG